jgi:hypothetical protein
MTKLIKLPKCFFVDHSERDLDTPVVIKETADHVMVSADDPALPELLSDAEFYAESSSYMGKQYFGLCMSARATARAIKAATM